ncbi:MAG: restriction endonuclease [Oscillospiraceae bacterium]|nr:restriction endonuclease [Oscillospiraceae bacterium]
MDINFDSSIIENYQSGTQIARVLTENWIQQNMYCPRCGNLHIKHFENNRPVADFFCPACKNEYELKSKNGILKNKINDGAYRTMIERITSNNNPDFLFMSYSKKELQVRELILVPKHFFVPDIIEKRKPLAASARRAGWEGCNILIDKIPEQGKIRIISNGEVIDANAVIGKVNKSKQFEIKDINSRGWLFDILNCVNRIPRQIFTLDEIYFFEKELQTKHPKNNNIKPKIRQQLQLLRDKGFIEFVGNGKYSKIV